MNGDPRAVAAARREEGGGDVMRRLTRQQGVFMISVAAELAEMHPQTLRMYEQRGLIAPQALAQGHAPVLAGRRRPAAPDPGADLRAGHEPRRASSGCSSSRTSSSACSKRVRALEERGRGAARPRWRRSSRRSAAPSAPSSCATRRRAWRSCRSAAAPAAAAEAPAASAPRAGRGSARRSPPSRSRSHGSRASRARARACGSTART